MEDVDLRYAKEHLDELIARAARGEDVRISDPAIGTVRLMRVPKVPDLLTPRITDTMEPFVPLKKPRVPGRLKGKLPPLPDDFFDPMSEEELKLWYGDDV